MEAALKGEYRSFGEQIVDEEVILGDCDAVDHVMDRYEMEELLLSSLLPVIQCSQIYRSREN